MTRLFSSRSIAGPDGAGKKPKSAGGGAGREARGELNG